MSLPVQNVAPQAVAAPGQTIFPFAWRCDDSLLVKVWVNDVLDGGFGVAPNADQTASPGGTITRAIACLGGEVVTVERASPQSQATDLTRYGAFAASSITNMLDKTIMLTQEMAAILGRCFRAARSAVAAISSLEFPAPSNKSLLQWQDDGTGHYKIGNVDSATVLASGLSEVTGEAVNRTGVGTYQLAFAPNPLSKVKIFLNGGRLKLGLHYTITGPGAITQLAGFISDPGEVMLADYTK